MRLGKSWAVLAALVVAACSSAKPLKDMVGYVPPTSLPAAPKRTLVADPRERVWAELLRFLEASDFEIDHVDEEKGLLVARYSGNPEPYIDCGSIVTHQKGSLGQIAGSSPTVALNYAIDDNPVVLNRSLNLDSRIIIRLTSQSQGTVIKTDTTYVVTKIVDVADPSGAVREGNRETVSFEAGGRGEFSKGTACQPNGSLDLAVLQSLPNIVGTDEIDQAELSEGNVDIADLTPPDGDAAAAPPKPASPELTDGPSNPVDEIAAADPVRIDGLDAAASPSPSPQPNNDNDDWVLPEQGLPAAALPEADIAIPSPEPPTNVAVIEGASEPPSTLDAPPPDLDRQIPTAPDADERGRTDTVNTTVTAVPETPVVKQLPIETEATDGAQSSTTVVDDTTRNLLESLDCGGDEWHFCDLVELTTPYRKRNIDELFGLTVNTTDSFTSQVVGRDLELDILFPSFPSHLHIAYARRDGTVDHVLSSPEVWPADLTHQLTEADRTVPGPAGLAMIIAIASEQPLFSAPPDIAEDATVYLDRLKQRLTELEAGNPEGPIAASQLLIYVENPDS